MQIHEHTEPLSSQFAIYYSAHVILTIIFSYLYFIIFVTQHSKLTIALVWQLTPIFYLQVMANCRMPSFQISSSVNTTLFVAVHNVSHPHPISPLSSLYVDELIIVDVLMVFAISYLIHNSKTEMNFQQLFVNPKRSWQQCKLCVRMK